MIQRHRWIEGIVMGMCFDGLTVICIQMCSQIFISLFSPCWLFGWKVMWWSYIITLCVSFFHRKDQRNVFSDLSKSILRYLSRSSLILLPNTKKCYHMMCYVFICLPNCKSFPLNNYSGKATAATLHVWSYIWSCYGGSFTRLFPQRRAMIIIITEQ